MQVIGFLGGSWDPTTRRLHVQRAFPVRQVDQPDNTLQAEMDAEHQVAVCAEVLALGMHVVGWCEERALRRTPQGA